MIGEKINEIDMQRTAGVTGSVGVATTTAGTETAETEQETQAGSVMSGAESAAGHVQGTGGAGGTLLSSNNVHGLLVQRCSGSSSTSRCSTQVVIMLHTLLKRLDMHGVY
jgi:hypothetical protein